MKRSLLFAILFLFIGVVGCQAALNEDNAIATAIADADARATAMSGALAAQGQLQGQVANGAVSIEGDDVEGSNAWPALAVPQSNNGVQAYTPYGGMGITTTEEYKTNMEVAATIDNAVRAGYLEKEEATAIIKTQIENMVYSVQPKRIIGIGPKTSGRHLLNLFGTLSWNSWWKVEQKPFHRQK